MIRIGSFQVESHVFLAPIAGYTDRSFRRAVRAAGHTGMCYTELLHAQGIQNNCRQALDIDPKDTIDRPLGVQIYGNDPDWLCDAARWAEQHGADIIDINMGCPVDKVTKTNGGSMLLCDCDRTTRLAERIVKSVTVPVTAKLRLGWDRTQLTAPRLAQQLEEIGVQLITIHGRTTKMRFKGVVDLDGIAAVVDAVDSIPVIGNGDIASVEDAERMVKHTKCDGVMVARASIKNPWIFSAIDHWMRTGTHAEPPTIAHKVQVIRQHFDDMRTFRNEREALSMMRGRIAAYGTTMGHIKPIKERIRTMQTPADLHAALDDLEKAIDPTCTHVSHFVSRALY